MAKAKPYESEAYLRMLYFTQGKSIDEIAAICGVSYNTIRTALVKKGFIK